MAARLLRNPAVRYGAPLVLFCVAGMYGLARVTENKVDAMDTRVKKRSERAVQLEMAHKAVVGKLNLDKYELRPVPRPPPAAGEEDDE